MGNVSHETITLKVDETFQVPNAGPWEWIIQLRNPQ